MLKGELYVFRRFIIPIFLCALLTSVALTPSSIKAQSETQTKGESKPDSKASGKKSSKGDNKSQNPTAEQIAEGAILIYGSRPGLEQIRRNGIERGRTTRIIEEGRTEEATYERRFIRGASLEKDRVRLDQKTPSVEYALLFGEGKTWGLLKGAAFIPKQDASMEFLSQQWHGLDALLRFKENGSTVSLVGKDKQKNVDMYILELTDKEKRRTRYYISAKFFRVLWLEYEEAAPGSATPVKYQRKFYDYRYAQGTLVPFRSVLYMDGKQASETQILTVTYGVKMDETLFQNPEAQAATATQNP